MQIIIVGESQLLRSSYHPSAALLVEWNAWQYSCASVFVFSLRWSPSWSANSAVTGTLRGSCFTEELKNYILFFFFFFSLVKLVKTKSVYCDTRASLDDCRVNARRCRLVMYENIFSVLWNEQTAAHQKLCFLSETGQRSWNHTRQLWPSHVQRLQNEQSHK